MTSKYRTCLNSCWSLTATCSSPPFFGRRQVIKSRLWHGYRFMPTVSRCLTFGSFEGFAFFLWASSWLHQYRVRCPLFNSLWSFTLPYVVSFHFASKWKRAHVNLYPVSFHISCAAISTRSLLVTIEFESSLTGYVPWNWTWLLDLNWCRIVSNRSSASQ